MEHDKNTLTVTKDMLPVHKDISDDIYLTLTRSINAFTRQITFKLPDTLVFNNGSYECSLTQCYLPDKFHPTDKFYIPEGSFYKVIKYCKATDKIQKLSHFKIQTEDEFNSIHDLIVYINTRVFEYMTQQFQDRFSIIIRFENNTLTLYPSVGETDVYSLIFSKELNDLLGFNDSVLRQPTGPLSVLHSSKMMFVHCDVIEPTLFNQSYEPLLRILSETMNSNLYPNYKTINKYFLNDITISIKGSEGNYISLSSGSICFVLHIRKKQWSKNLL